MKYRTNIGVVQVHRSGPDIYSVFNAYGMWLGVIYRIGHNWRVGFEPGSYTTRRVAIENLQRAVQ